MNFVNKKLIEFNEYVTGKKVAVIGLGVSNIPLLEYLYELGADITIFHNKNIETIDKLVLDKIYEYKLKFHFGEKYLLQLVNFDIIFRSPSCRPDLPEIQRELNRGAILTSEIEMFLELCPCKTIGITGSDGKTTTSTLIYEILKEKGYKVYLGGNIGNPLFTKLQDIKPEDFVVLELSSFQLMNMQISPNIAVVTNISPNHLDIHKSYKEYIESKENIFKFQSEEDLLVLNFDNEITKDFAKKANGKVVFFSKKVKLQDGVVIDKDIIKYCNSGLRRHILNIENMKIKGIHNAENACAAIAATHDYADIETQAKALIKFTGVEHRIEFVKELKNVKWYNDAIATSPTRTIAGLNSFNERIVLICGGYDKHLDYSPIAKPIVKKVSKLIVMGQTAEKISDAVKKELEQQKKKMEIYKVEDMQQAINKAKEVAIKGEVILMSPASASFDMFKNFVEKGNKFKELVNKI